MEQTLKKNQIVIRKKDGYVAFIDKTSKNKIKVKFYFPKKFFYTEKKEDFFSKYLITEERVIDGII
ncbi:hypothetical protein CRU98_13255 [Arcobacter sp. CECT 8986]|uniref:hypothetical protein n=1 Tax=Arcobacter sp. CECT 8986 TaxID=2044507 RepID=UPI0010099D95|nr:hypothetical protein [Arcobacter sp. CECT 8986]RXJ97595.1 hypothetical protein CRU98_13255 [Arcobacter sp. CECT 8986]